jgi:hypothetical protein
MSLTALFDKFSGSSVRYNEFVFIIDCSGSMSGVRIKQAADCLDLFIRSLPQNSFFNIVRFGSRFEKLFPESVSYTEEHVATAFKLAHDLEADFGGTELLAPLEAVYGENLKGGAVRQVFVITDGQVHNTERVIESARGHRQQNRCFAIGIGGGADAGLVEGIADATGGRADFVEPEDDLSLKVIPQLELSLQPTIADLSVHIENHEALQLAPFPLTNVTPDVASTFFVRTGQPFEGSQSVLITGQYLGESADVAVESQQNQEMGRCLRALFAFESIRSLEREIRINGSQAGELRERCVVLSIESGVLCSETAFVGFSPFVVRRQAPMRSYGGPRRSGGMRACHC